MWNRVINRRELSICSKRYINAVNSRSDDEATKSNAGR